MRLRIVTIILLLGLASLCGANPSPPAESFLVPSENCRDYFLIPITLATSEDSPAAEPLWFLYDTGASETWVDPSSVERASGVRVETGQRAVIRDATAGPVKFNKLRAKVGNLDHLSHALGREIDGILSYSTFKKYLLTIDYQHHELRIEKGQLPKPDGENIFSTKGPDSRPWLHVEFPSRKRRMLIDSGAAASSLALNKLSRYETTGDPVASGATFRLKKIELKSAARAAGNAKIGPHILIQPTLQSTPGTELIGGKVMRHFNWTFDQKNKRVRIDRFEPQTPITFESVVVHGMVLKMHQSGFRVRSVIANTPAAKAGLRAGDVVTHWNGVPVSERGCSEWPAAAKLLTLNLLRDGTELVAELFLFPLVD